MMRVAVAATERDKVNPHHAHRLVSFVECLSATIIVNLMCSLVATANPLIIGSTHIWDADGQQLVITKPTHTQPGDLMLLILHRTDDELPFAQPGWTRAAECYKQNNDAPCYTLDDCSEVEGAVCTQFQGSHRGRDLAQVIFYRVAADNEPAEYVFNLNRDGHGEPGWAILTSLRGVDAQDPVRDWAVRGCDSDHASVFPSVTGQKGDWLLLSQSFDDAVPADWFQPPRGMTGIGYVSHSDEAGFLFAKQLTEDGPTGEIRTRGPGGPRCKDALISLTLKPAHP
ncbi:MAG: hypothetical protein D6758_03340 [Gammaproteobacteria bacterium]|nr:MAG: hypothetical protein D6758_03340 [Gammaproteobacteria bacterium]